MSRTSSIELKREKTITLQSTVEKQVDGFGNSDKSFVFVFPSFQETKLERTTLQIDKTERGTFELKVSHSPSKKDSNDNDNAVDEEVCFQSTKVKQFTE